MLAAEAAVLAELDPLRRLLLVLRRAVVPTLALAAREMNDVSHTELRRVWGLATCPSGPESLVPQALFQNLGDRARADRAAAFANREARALFERHRRNQLPRDRRVVPRHHHLHALGQLQHPRHVRRPDVE